VPLWIPITVAAALFSDIPHDDASQKIRGIFFSERRWATTSCATSTGRARWRSACWPPSCSGPGPPVASISLPFLGLVDDRRSRPDRGDLAHDPRLLAAQLCRRHGLFEDRDGVRRAVRHLHRPRAAEVRRLDRHPGLPGRRDDPERARSLANVRSVLADLTHKARFTESSRARSSRSPPSPSARPPSSCPTAIS